MEFNLNKLNSLPYKSGQFNEITSQWLKMVEEIEQATSYLSGDLYEQFIQYMATTIQIFFKEKFDGHYGEQLQFIDKLGSSMRYALLGAARGGR